MKRLMRLATRLLRALSWGDPWPEGDAALDKLIPADPRPAGRVEDRPEWLCRAMHGKGRDRRACGKSKTPEQETCGRPACRAWAGRQAKRVPGKVLTSRWG